ncbi:exported hypothetical protein [Vibrio coralliirubri]|nr:exported hypothetical protein [Vibrio coralliirubri]
MIAPHITKRMNGRKIEKHQYTSMAIAAILMAASIACFEKSSVNFMRRPC